MATCVVSEIADLAHHDHIGILADECTERGAKCESDFGLYLRLIDAARLAY